MHQDTCVADLQALVDRYFSRPASVPAVASDEVGDWVEWTKVPLNALVRVRAPDHVLHGAVALRRQSSGLCMWVVSPPGFNHRWSWPSSAPPPLSNKVLIIAKGVQTSMSRNGAGVLAAQCLVSELIDDRWKAAEVR